MEHIFQRTSHDCGVAALAMFCGYTYEDMLELCLQPSGDHDGALPIYREGWGMNKETVILQRLGLWDYPAQSGKDVDFKVMRFGKPMFLEAEYFRNIAWGRKTLMMVPSLNVEGGFHFICTDNNKVLDPNDPAKGKKVYTKFEELKPVDIYIMRDESNDI